MKAFVVLCFAAAVSAEADPQLLALRAANPFYTSLLPSVYRRPEELKRVEYKTVVPSTYAVNPLTYGLAAPQIVPRYYAKSAEGVEHIVAKREAEAEADPFYFYSAGVPYTTPYGINAPLAAYPSAYGYPLASTGLKTYANDAVSAKNYAGKGQYVAENAGAIHVAKREAEAEADPAVLLRGISPYVPAVSTYSAAYPATYPISSYRTVSPYAYGINNLAYPSIYY